MKLQATLPLPLGLLILMGGPSPAAALGESPPLRLRDDGSSGARREVAEALVARSEATMGRHLDAAFRARLVERLAAQPIEDLRGRLDGGGDGPAAPGDSSADLVYTPVTPCRAFDTRPTNAGMLTPNAPRDFRVAGDGLALQGGHPAGCGIPLGPATAVVVNLAVINATGDGHLTAWAVADPTPPPPFASVLNFGPLAHLPALANAVVLPICDDAGIGGSCSSDVRIQAFVSSAHVLGDVLGYFRKIDLGAELPAGADLISPVAATAGSLLVAPRTIVTPARVVECVVTCSFTLTSSAANLTGHASVQGGARHVDSGRTVWGGPPMSAAPVAFAGDSSATQVVEILLGAGQRFQFGCFVAADGDFLGDEIKGTVAWSCR
jgi:hypothetical protein